MRFVLAAVAALSVTATASEAAAVDASLSAAPETVAAVPARQPTPWLSFWGDIGLPNVVGLGASWWPHPAVPVDVWADWGLSTRLMAGASYHHRLGHTTRHRHALALGAHIGGIVGSGVIYTNGLSPIGLLEVGYALRAGQFDMRVMLGAEGFVALNDRGDPRYRRAFEINPTVSVRIGGFVGR